MVLEGNMTAGQSFPVQKNERIVLQISGINHSGEGVGRYRGLAVFVPGAAPGDQVVAEVSDVKKNYARARLLGIKTASPARREPECGRFSRCGGCRLQHINYGEQLMLKTILVKDSLARIAGLEKVKVRAAAGMEHPWHYRNKVHFQVEERPDKIALGFYEEGTHNLTAFFNEGACPGTGCLLVDDELNKLAALIEKLLNRHRGPFGRRISRQKRQSRFFRHIVLRKGFFTGEVMAVLVTGSGEWPGEKAFVKELLSLRPGLVSLVRNINDGPPGVLFGKKSRCLAGREHIKDRLGHLIFRISPSSFYQVNPVQTLVLYNKVQQYAALTGTETVVDAYSGIGSIALFLAGRAKRVYGLEALPDAVADARKNAALNKITNAEFLTGKVESLIPILAAQGQRPEVVVLDPPRHGCGREVLEAVVQMQVPRLVYVSCNPATLARDLRYLADNGYLVDEVQPVDMFPWTAHVECVVLMSRL